MYILYKNGVVRTTDEIGKTELADIELISDDFEKILYQYHCAGCSSSASCHNNCSICDDYSDSYEKLENMQFKSSIEL